MKSRVILLGDFNAHSPDWNMHCGEMRNTSGLEALIKGHDLILNNEPGQSTGPTRKRRTSIIDRISTTLELGTMDTWIIDEELSTTSENEVVVFVLANMGDIVGGMRTS